MSDRSYFSSQTALWLVNVPLFYKLLGGGGCSILVNEPRSRRFLKF